MRFNSILLLLFILTNSVFSQNQEVDSLRSIYKNSNIQEEKLSSLLELTRLTKYSDFNNALIYGKKAIELAVKLDDTNSEAEARNNLGLSYASQSKFKEALNQYEKALELFTQLKNEEMIGVVYNNLGLLYSKQNNYAKELEYHHKAIDIFSKYNLPSRKAMSLINIGNVSVAKKDYKTAGEYYVKAYQIYKQLDDKDRLVTCLNNIAAVYMYAGEKKLSLSYFDKNLEILETMENVDRKKAMVLYNSSGVLMDLNDFDEAEKRLTEALILCKKIEDKESLAICHHNIGGLYRKKEMFKEAEYNYLKSLEYCTQVKYRDLEIENYKHLAKVYESSNEYKKAYENYTKYAAIKDSIFNKQIQKINEVEKKYLAEKTAKEIELVNLQKKESELQAKQIKIIGGASILVLLIIVFSIFSKYKDKKKTSLILAEKNKEITDSIQYAKRIQKAILPPSILVNELLPNSFVLYKPKDIVAGDFYWLEKKDDKVLFAAADCTGHGVPGAMVSVICNNGLNRSVREHGLTDPGKILDKTRELVVAEFEKSEQEVKDGMDIALCYLDGNKMQYAGAHNPLWIIRNGDLIEIKANKQPIGKFDNPEPYTTHVIELQKGDSIYIFSDGYADQFGGEKGKKLKTVNFKKLLISIQNENMQKQKELIDEAFEEWKGDIEQLDDVCVIGVRI